VVGVENFKPGHNDESFRGAVTDTDRDRGFVEFHDLEVNGHPSYFANGVAVHNCHKWSNDAQNAALKMLEDTPAHVYFLLATTDPQKLIKPILTRCTEMPVRLLTHDELKTLLQRVAKKEKITLTADIEDELITSAQGSARTLLVLLDKIANLTDDQRSGAIADKLSEENEAIDLCRALIKGDSWKTVAGILRNLKGEPESIRWAVLGYARAVLLNKGDHRSYLVIDIFKNHFFDSKESGLAAACYEVCHASK
jgi:DNA polymerase III gamma/tau subunit